MQNVLGKFGRNLKQKRLEQGLTQDELAEKAALSVDTIKRYESGHHCGVHLLFVYDIANALGISIQALLPPQDCSIQDSLLAADAHLHAALEKCNIE